MPTTTQPEGWVPTGRAIQATGLSRTTLHRWRDNGLLEAGTHFKAGLTPRSPFRWNVGAIEKTIADRSTTTPRPFD